MGRRVLLSIFLGVLVSCATPYQKAGITGGYSDRQLSDSAYLVTFNGNGYASKEHVWNLWFYRCAELTLQKGYAYFLIRPERTGALAEPALMPAAWRPGRGHLHKAYYYVTTVTTWNSSGTVLMFPRPMPQEVLWAFDAQAVIDQLKPYVIDRAGQPPSRTALLESAFRSHTRVEFTSVTPPVAAGEGAPGAAPLAPRSADDIRAGADGSRLSLLDLFQAYRRSGARAQSGTVTVALTVTPNGLVAECALVSSTFPEPAFGEAVVERCRKMSFAPASAAPTRVPALAISFSPAPA